MDVSIDSSSLGDLGAPKPIELPATRYRQGGRTMYHLTVTLAQVTQLIPKRPDPEHPIEGNRRVDGSRAKKFGQYFLNNPDWVSPAIIVRAPSGEIDFKSIHEFPDGTAWGVLKVPLHVLTEILPLDGQHRVLGTFLGIDDINESIRKKRDGVEKAEANGNGEVAAEMQATLAELIETRERVNDDHISIDLAVVTTDRAKQMFADINNNAKGVNPDYTTVLDQREVVNRIAVELMDEHPLLKDRVEFGQSTRMSATNPNLVGAKTVANIVRAVYVGISGRVGARVEDEMNRNLPAAVKEVSTFLDILAAGFEDLEAVMDGDLDPVDLRSENSPNRSMIGSSTMLRALAGAYHNLRMEPVDPSDAAPLTRSEIETFFASLAPKLRDIPIREDDSFWMSTGAFIPGSAAPQARQGTMNSLVQSLVVWAREGHPELATTTANVA